MPKTDTKPNAKNRIYKAIETWFTKIYLNKIIHNAKDTSIFINKSSCLAFILSIYGKTDENKSKMTPAVIAHINTTKNTFTAKLKRVKNHESIIDLQAKYPKLDIVSAYQFLTLKDKFKITKSEIQDFETLIDILSKNAQKSKK
ncbi:hypothetical protein FW605_09110 [Campylobacter coli]|uniref:Uncharacterized protein n=1 Tax=Campylobacter coli TaxID=195 RepID=A0A8S8E330_CAMCO|nr:MULTISPECIES: hypothetical protein [Campylobacter]HEE6703337.1 hypothetical protein [Campylobacter jejuni subsp. jejuni]ALU99814.1 hypothetical protein ATE51_02592 [Campylobacter coli]ALV00028.1 hypothetical protein ATE51_03018 [Campylobacter coli]AVS38058.1 hypothetical protein C9J81_00780 [Campylobacter coli]EAH5261898.1 hypothetical protein [Campylobacter coli]